MTDGGFPTMDGTRVGGRDVDWQPMTRPDQAPVPVKTGISPSGLAEFVVAILAIGMGVAGSTILWGLGGSLLAGSLGLLLAVVWSRKDGSS